MIEKPKVFPHFPQRGEPAIVCPVCLTSEDAECVLVPVDGTIEGSIQEAAVVHLWCALPSGFRRDRGLLYRWVTPQADPRPRKTDKTAPPLS